MQLLDVTLREGEQRSGVSYSVEQKVRGAELLDALGVDYVQVGFPVANDGTAAVCDRLDIDATVVGMARAIEGDVDAAVEAGVDLVEFAVPASDIQREHVLGISREAVIEKAAEVYDHAREYGVEVHVGAMDSFRADPGFLEDLATAVDPPMFTLLDTVGIATPDEVVSVVEAIDRDPSRLGVHFHRDLGVATANVLAAAGCGVGKADATVGGIGDRVGNVALEEVVVAGTVGTPRIEFDVDLDRLVPACRELLDVLGESVAPNKAVIGELAFEHESGMHTAAMLDEPSVYEAFDPARFGAARRLLFGESSGRGAARRLLERAGAAEPSEEAVAAFLDELHALDDHVELSQALAMAESFIAART